MPDSAVLHEPWSDRPRTPPSWIVGLAFFPFGLALGFTVTALPFLLTRQGIPLDRVASISALVLSPTFWGFLVCPVLDTGLTRRAYCWLTAAAGAACIVVALGVLSPARLGMAAVLLLVAELAMVMYGNATTGWMSEFLPDHMRGSASGWTNVANLGGGAMGSLAVMSLASHMRMQWVGLGLAVCMVLGVLPTVAFPKPHRSSFAFKRVFKDTVK